MDLLRSAATRSLDEAEQPPLFSREAPDAGMNDGDAREPTLQAATSDVVFVCYARDDEPFTRRLAADLQDAGTSIWMDSLNILAGADWDAEIERALVTAHVLLLVLSPAAEASSSVRNELSYALDRRRRVVPVMYRTCSLPLRLARAHWIDFRSDYNQGLARLLDRLRGDKLADDRSDHSGRTANFRRRRAVVVGAGGIVAVLAGVGAWFGRRGNRRGSLTHYSLEIVGDIHAYRGDGMDTRTTLVFDMASSIEVLVRPDRPVFEETVAGVFARERKGQSTLLRLAHDDAGGGLRRFRGRVAESGLGPGEWHIAVVVARAEAMPQSYDEALAGVDSDGIGSGYTVNLGQIAVRP